MAVSKTGSVTVAITSPGKSDLMPVTKAPAIPGGRRFAAMLDKLLGWACYDSTRIERELGYRPVWTLARYMEAALLDVEGWRD